MAGPGDAAQAVVALANTSRRAGSVRPVFNDVGLVWQTAITAVVMGCNGDE